MLSLALIACAQNPFVEEARLLPAGGGDGDECGSALAVEGQRLLVGAWGESTAAFLAGAAFVWERQPGGAWIDVAKLVPSDGGPQDEFGGAVALSGDRALIGSARHDLPASNQGAAYVFERQAGGAWVETAKLSPDDLGQNFGGAVALEGDRALIGCYAELVSGIGQAGATYVFERQPGGAWVKTAKLLASDGTSADSFGRAVALSGDLALIGARGDSVFASDSGSSYVFERQPGGTWQEVAKLVPSDGGMGEAFGNAVALDGARALIGAYRHAQPALQSGAAYLFERQAGGVWVQTAKLSPADADEVDWIGADVDLQGRRALLGAPMKDVDEPGVPKGAAYVFEQEQNGTWHETARLELPDPLFQDEYGTMVALEGERAFVGAPLRDDLGTSSGSAHVMHLEPLQGAPETLSLSGGGAQVFELSGGLHHAGLPFFLLGTASGTAPGIVLPSASGGPLLLPLNPDGWFFFTVNHPNTPPLFGSLAAFDGLGLAAAGFVVPPASDPALAGLLLHHAYLVLAPPQPVFASNAVPLRLVP